MRVLLAPEMSALGPVLEQKQRNGEKGLPTPTLKLDVPLTLQSQQTQTI